MALFKSGLRALNFARKHLRLVVLELEGVLGTRDAALTALVCLSAGVFGTKMRFGIKGAFVFGAKKKTERNIL